AESNRARVPHELRAGVVPVAVVLPRERATAHAVAGLDDHQIAVTQVIGGGHPREAGSEDDDLQARAHQRFLNSGFRFSANARVPSSRSADTSTSRFKAWYRRTPSGMLRSRLRSASSLVIRIAIGPLEQMIAASW